MRTPKEFDYDLWIDRNDGQCYGDIAPAWAMDRDNSSEDALFNLLEEELIRSLTAREADVYKHCIVDGMKYKLMLKEYPDVMNIEQMCEILGISTKTGYRILREGKVCCIKVGRAYRIPKAHLFTYLSIGCAELQEAANA